MRAFPTIALMALVCVLATAPAAWSQDVAVHGFASQGFLRSSANNYLGDTEDGSAEYQEFAFNISSQIQDDLRVGVQFFARDLGPLGNNEIELDWAFGDYRWHDQLGFRVGRYKMPYGFYNETADFDAARTAVLMPSGVYDMRYRDLLVAANGVQAYGRLNLIPGMNGGIDYTAFYGTTGAEQGGSVDRTFDAAYDALPDPAMGGISTGTNMTDLTVNYLAGGSLQWETPLQGLRVGASLVHYDADFTFRFNDPNFAGIYQQAGGVQDLLFTTKNTNFSVIGAEYTWGDFVFAAEQSRWKGDFESQAPSVVAQLPANMFDPSAPDGMMMEIPIGVTSDQINYESWYAQGSYRVNEWLEFGSYYSIYYQNADDKNRDDPNAFQQDIAVSARFDVSYAMTVKLEAHFMDGYAQLLSDINQGLLGAGDLPEENWTMFAAKTSFVF